MLSSSGCAGRYPAVVTRKFIPGLLFFLTICGLGAGMYARAESPASTPLRITGAETGVLLTPSAQVLEDPSGKLDLDRVRMTASGWRAGPEDALVFGFSRSAWWVRWQLENTGEQPARMAVDLGSPRQDYIQWFVLRSGGHVVEESAAGDRLPFAQRALPTRNFALPLTLAPHERVEMYVRLASYDGLFEAMPLRVLSLDSFFAEGKTENLLFTIYHGGLIALALYNLLLFIATRERNFGLYGIYLLSFLTWSFTFRGYSFEYLWPNAPAFNNDILTVGAAWTFGTIGLFAIAYLRMRETVPRWLLRLNVTLVVLNLLVTVPALLGYYALGAGIGLVTGCAIALVTLGTAIWLLSRGSRQARFFVIAFATVSIGAGAYMLQIVSVLPTNWFTSWAVQIGSAIEVLLLALGLADSMNILKAEKLEAERAAHEAQQVANVRLEQQVIERTQAVELANRRLRELAITDELTGAFNRRHFNELCNEALTHRRRTDPLAFCMFDIDHFKAFNDTYGHQVGDTALRDIARAVQGELRRSGDVLFRLGGEEFGLLFAAASPEMAKQFIERLRATVHRLGVPHTASATGTITASFGVGWWGAGVVYRLTPEQMYATADAMLYQAKEAGRDRVELDALFPTGEHPAAQMSIAS